MGSKLLARASAHGWDDPGRAADNESRVVYRTDGMTISFRLVNWGRWTRTNLGEPDASCENPIYANFIPSKAWDAGWGDQPAPESLPPPIDEPDAWIIDDAMMLIADKHFAILKKFYHMRRPALWEDLDAAHRAITDCLKLVWGE